jgi:spore germination cell wall hydrolase CwlJ-like protein
MISLGIVGYSIAKDEEERNEQHRLMMIEVTKAEQQMLAQKIAEQQMQEQVEVLSKIQPKSPEYYDLIEILARVIHAEESNEVNGEDASWAVAGVILERVYDENYPDTIEGVIYQQGQFECTWNGGMYREEPTDIEYEIAAEAVRLYYEGGRILPEGSIYIAEFVQGDGVVMQFGKTYVCRKETKS